MVWIVRKILPSSAASFGRFSFQLHQFLIEPRQILVAFDEKFPNYFQVFIRDAAALGTVSLIRQCQSV